MSAHDGDADALHGPGFDGIHEYDRKLPRWWLWTFYGTCVFSLVYWLATHTLGIADLPADEYAAELRIAAEREAERAQRQPLDDASLAALQDDPATVAAGREVFTTNCVSCHGPNGAGFPGSIGPNLTDRYWLHGSSPTDVYRTITKGLVEKGMLARETTLGPARCRQVTAFVLTLRGQDLSGGKEPQGQEVQ